MSRPLPATPAWRALLARWGRWQQSFDGRSMRERVLLGATGLAMTLALADMLWLSPAAAALKKARQEHISALDSQARLQQDLQHLELKASQLARQQRADLDSWRARARDTEAALQAHERTLIGPDQMVALFEGLLAQQERPPGAGRQPVRVRGMQSLPRTDLLAAATNAGPAANAPVTSASASPPALPSLYRHGLELTLEGSFGDLLAYLTALEALPQRLQWGSLSLQVQQHPTSVLTLRLHTLSRDRHWFEI